MLEKEIIDILIMLEKEIIDISPLVIYNTIKILSI